MNETVEQLRFVEFGGGTGSQVVLEALREFANNGADIVAVTPSSDDGGHSGQLCEEFGIVAPGDIRSKLTSMASNVAEKARYSRRDAGGRSMGNIILQELQIVYGLNLQQAIAEAEEELDTFGRVIPVSHEPLKLELFDGDRHIVGESNIGRHTIVSSNARIELSPQGPMSPDLEEAILEADYLIVSPSNFHLSVLAIMARRGMQETLRDSNAQLTFVSPLLTIPGHTSGWHAATFVEHLERYIGEGRVDSVLHHQSPLSPHLLEYARPGEREVATDIKGFNRIGARAIGVDFVLQQPFETDPNDTATPRTRIRQSPELLLAALKDHIVEPSRQRVTA